MITIAPGGGIAVQLTLLGVPWPENERHRRHWRELHDHDEQWKNASRLLAVDAANRLRLKPFERSIVTVEYHFPSRRRRDPDGYAVAAKGLLDGLVGVLIVDDDFDHIELRVRARHEPTLKVNGPRTLVVVERVA